ncbi:Glutaredoxin-C1 [Bienertia sinuspersici]
MEHMQQFHELDEMPEGNEIDKALQRLGQVPSVPALFRKKKKKHQQFQPIGQVPSVPALFVGHKYVGGTKEIISLQVQGRLVPLLREAKAIWV